MDRIADEEGQELTKKDRCERRRTVIADEELELIEEGPLQTKTDCCGRRRTVAGEEGPLSQMKKDWSRE
jgi:hypothetical protein